MPWLDGPFKEINVEEVYRKDVNLHKEDVMVINEWIKNQPHLPQITELQALLFLHSEFYNVERAKHIIDNFFTIKTLSPELFGSRTLNDPVLNTASRCLLMAPLQQMTSSGDLIIVGKLMDKNVANYTAEGHVKLFDVVALLCFHQIGPVNGIQLIADLKNSSFSHFMRFSTSIIHRFINYLQDAMPIRLRYVHLINMSYFVEKFLSLIRPFIKKELFELIKVHSNIESLHQYIPQVLLPEDYGGSTDSTEILQGKVIQLLENSEEFLKFQDSQVADLPKKTKMSSH